MKVVWDDAKNLANQKKHGVSFEEAAELLASDEARLDIFDEEHSDNIEERFISIRSHSPRLGTRRLDGAR